MGLEPVIAPSALKHEVAAADILHAYDNSIRVFKQDDEVSMVIGPARDATLLEVGCMTAADGAVVVIHAMKARRKYLDRLKK